MNKKIKIIDLINMQYKKEKMPKNIRIKYSLIFDYYTYNEEIKWYETADKTTILDVFQKLDYEVEIIEEQKEIDIKGIKELYEYKDITNYDDIEIAQNRMIINQLVQAVKQLDKNIKEK